MKNLLLICLIMPHLVFAWGAYIEPTTVPRTSFKDKSAQDRQISKIVHWREKELAFVLMHSYNIWKTNKDNNEGISSTLHLNQLMDALRNYEEMVRINKSLFPPAPVPLPSN